MFQGSMAYSQPRWCILRQHAMDPWSIVFYVSHWNLIQYSHHDISLYIISTYTLVELRTLCSTDSHLPGLTMTSLKKVTANKASMTKKTKRSWRIHLTKQKQKIKPTNTFWILLRLEGCFEAIFDVWDMLFTQVPCKKKGQVRLS